MYIYTHVMTVQSARIAICWGIQNPSLLQEALKTNSNRTNSPISLAAHNIQ